MDVLNKEIENDIESDQAPQSSLEDFLKGKKGEGILTTPSIRSELRMLLQLADGFDMIADGQGGRVTGNLNDRGTAMLTRLLSGSDTKRIDAFVEAIVASGFRAGIAPGGGRPDLIGLKANDAWAVENIMNGHDPDNLADMVSDLVTPKGGNDKVYAALTRAFGPTIIEGTLAE